VASLTCERMGNNRKRTASETTDSEGSTAERLMRRNAGVLSSDDESRSRFYVFHNLALGFLLNAKLYPQSRHDCVHDKAADGAALAFGSNPDVLSFFARAVDEQGGSVAGLALFAIHDIE
jgi:hypothetical protein